MNLTVNGQEIIDVFISELVATLQLKSPTVVYDSDEGVPEICYSSPWILCLSSEQPGELVNDSESYGEFEKDGMNI